MQSLEKTTVLETWKRPTVRIQYNTNGACFTYSFNCSSAVQRKEALDTWNSSIKDEPCHHQDHQGHQNYPSFSWRIPKKGRMFGTNRPVELVDHYTQVTWQCDTWKTINGSYDPLVYSPYRGPSLSTSTRVVKRNNESEMCHNNNTREHTQAPIWERVIKTRSGRISKISRRYFYH